MHESQHNLDIKESWNIQTLHSELRQKGFNPDKLYLFSFHIDENGDALYHSVHEGRVVGKEGFVIYFEENNQKMMINVDTENLDQFNLVFSFQDAENPDMREAFSNLYADFIETLDEQRHEIVYH